MCPKCEVPVEGDACALCGSPVQDLDAQKRAVIDLHNKVLSSKDDDEKSALLRNAPIPDDPEVLIDAGLRCVPLMESFEPGDSASARLQAIVVKLKLFPEDERIAKAIAEFEKHIRAQGRANLKVGIGCAVLIASILGVGIWLLIKYVF
jgi:hypothetical protein